jgi:TPR repeat protein
LGTAYNHGLGVKADKKEAVRWWKRASEKNDASNPSTVQAWAMLGEAYAIGQGVAVDLGRAFKYTEKAANAGNVNSQFTLGTFYFEGRFVPVDKVEGLFWIKKASQGGLRDEAVKYLSKQMML